LFHVKSDLADEAALLIAVLAEAAAWEATAGEAAAAEGEPVPRVLQFWDHPGGMQVNADEDVFFIARGDLDGLERFCAMIRVEFSDGVAGRC
jgi:hypothetical protein